MYDLCNVRKSRNSLFFTLVLNQEKQCSPSSPSAPAQTGGRRQEHVRAETERGAAAITGNSFACACAPHAGRAVLRRESPGACTGPARRWASRPLTRAAGPSAGSGDGWSGSSFLLRVGRPGVSPRNSPSTHQSTEQCPLSCCPRKRCGPGVSGRCLPLPLSLLLFP